MSTLIRSVIYAAMAVLLLGALVLAASRVPPLQAQQAASAAAGTVVMPQYDAARNLRLPSGYREWVLVGTSLGLS